VNTEHIRGLVAAELARIADDARRRALADLLTDPSAEEREWDYGPDGQTHPCWVIARHTDRGVALVYCQSGFGPTYPWGAVPVDLPRMGRDDSWFASLDDAFIVSGLWGGPLPPDYEVQ